MPEPPVSEHEARGTSGWAALIIGLALIAGGITLAALDKATAAKWGAAALILAGVLALAGLPAVPPGQARVLALFGRYTGSVRATGLRFVNPFTKRRRVSTRI